MILPFLFFKLIGQLQFIFLCAGQHGFDLLEGVLVLCYILRIVRRKAFKRHTVPLTTDLLLKSLEFDHGSVYGFCLAALPRQVITLSCFVPAHAAP